ncbi:alpha,alpha-trehalose-phosphate synthase [UDP-forming], putative [Phytophthora infestans T30-4]|uniref:Alpha,alpha-trehalose-phosphate synthase [UDP-forming], putative n=1 Tax=Phytophthora infestans (strain T30-4) TaxID=403677 RepID=D0MWP2_PHYIT|nr:alpha,alpha-trehalose-phosphate synthase [UDP-forming], putative [Phytophthora infestans T30-4]EEY64055.1 alpha,alpha-trehalose-phosphate synthase [UDP-forming], putative [Phytophthora infestans T30-4]|eukprot:XP_002907491.1 alpha,alpha-trehalose-phosphate synthase [UDP-forming], putative [Phytophthora infestans T30-4]
MINAVFLESENEEKLYSSADFTEEKLDYIAELLATTQIYTRNKIPTIKSIQQECCQKIQDELAAVTQVNDILASHNLPLIDSANNERLKVLVTRLRQQEQQLAFHRGLLKAQRELSNTDSGYSIENFAFGSTPFPTWLNLFTQKPVLDVSKVSAGYHSVKLTNIKCNKNELEGVQPFFNFKFDSFRNPPSCAHPGRVKVMPHVPSPPKTVLIVVNVLPLVFERNVSSASGWDVSLATGATAMLYRTLVRDADKYSPLYIGCPEVFVAKSEEAALEKQLLALRCVPVFLDPPVAHRYFQGFCKGVLWPVFHNVVDVYNSAELQLDCEEQEAKGKFLWFGEKKEESSGVKSAWCDPVSWNPAAQDMCWSDYCSVNRTFARRVVESYHAGDLVWLHDFHFLMLPSYLLRRLRTALVTMYLHVPFPSSEIFRCLAMRTEILRAMLCADHIGFLVFEHARHFLTSCKRLLGLDYKTFPNGMLVIEYNGRKIHISCSHVEPDVTHLHEMLDQNVADVNGAALDFAADVKNAITAGRDPEQRRIVIGSVDRLEGLTAIPLKLRAFDRFLATHPDKRGSVVLVQIGITLDSRPNDYHRTRDYVLKFTEEINRRYAPRGGVVVYFEEKRKTTCAERVILWRMCDIYLDTCVRGGLSLLPFEYMIAQHRNIQSKSRHPTGWSSPRGNLDVSGLDRSFGLMIVSEFSAYSRILSGSLAVNPWKTDDMVAAFAKACGMSYYEKHNRFYMNYKFLVGRSDSTPWGERLLGDVEAVTEKMEDGTSGEVVQVGFGFDFRVMRFESGFVCLDVDDLVKKCSRTSRRLFIFDYGGTLSSTASILDEEGAQFSHRAGCVDQSSQKLDTSDRSGVDCTGQSAARYIDGKVRKPISDETRANLQTLCADSCNVVFVISNTQRGALEDQFGSIPNLNLVAENGLFIKIGNREHWECVCDEDKRTFDWKDDVKSVMQAYAARTNGSFLVENAASLLYDYRNSDQEYGEIQSLELCAQLAKIAELSMLSLRMSHNWSMSLPVLSGKNQVAPNIMCFV